MPATPPSPRRRRAATPRILAVTLLGLVLGAPSSIPSAAAGVTVAGWGLASAAVPLAALEPGPSSLTERQARQRLAALRFNSVRFLRKDPHGFWRGRAWQAGQEVEVAVDFRGRIAAGPEVAALDRVRPPTCPPGGPTP
jgi:hypothetical protein